MDYWPGSAGKELQLDIKRLLLTIRYLKPKQVYYRLYYLIKGYFGRSTYLRKIPDQYSPLEWKQFLPNQPSYLKENTFVFLNIQQRFAKDIDWNCGKYGKLWIYNLNYFDFLNQPDVSDFEGLNLIEDYIRNDAILKDGKEPYPISLRGINWIKFLSRYCIINSDIDQTLYYHYQILFHNLEYHLLGNHLLENGFSLFFGAYYFQDNALYKRAVQILKAELNEQILSDGAHFELSPMYHQIILHRMLDCINLIENNPWKTDELLQFLKQKAQKMLAWLKAITYKDGSVPMVNDCAYDIAPAPIQLFDYANNLGVLFKVSTLKESGYRMFRRENYELFVDVGNIGPNYQPGHAHSDTFSFELYMNGAPVIVDTGTSTYEKNARRQLERETISHNTVKIGNEDQSEVWGGFRVAARARITDLVEGPGQVKATHNGYKKLNVLHSRSFNSENNRIEIIDSLDREPEQKQFAFFHFHPSIQNIEIVENDVFLSDLSIGLHFDNAVSNIEILTYSYATGFNRTVEAHKLAVNFQKTLRTQIDL